MTLRDADLATLAMVKAGLSLDHRHGVLLMDDEETLIFFTAEIAPDHHLYIEVRNEFAVYVQVGVFRRPRSHISRMIRAQYSGCRIHRDALGLAGQVGGLIEPLDIDEMAAYETAWAEFSDRDVALTEELGGS